MQKDPCEKRRHPGEVVESLLGLRTRLDGGRE